MVCERSKTHTEWPRHRHRGYWFSGCFSIHWHRKDQARLKHDVYAAVHYSRRTEWIEPHDADEQNRPPQDADRIHDHLASTAAGVFIAVDAV